MSPVAPNWYALKPPSVLLSEYQMPDGRKTEISLRPSASKFAIAVPESVVYAVVYIKSPFGPPSLFAALPAA